MYGSPFWASTSNNVYNDRFHPCQALSDFFTLKERFGGLRGLKFAYVGDGNNICHSLLSIAARVGAHIRVATPAGYEPDASIVAEAKRVARETRGKIEVIRSAEDAVAGAQAVYTDVWASMRQEEESAAREVVFAGYQVNEALFLQAASDAVFLHCLPAHRGSKVTDAVIDSEHSIIFDQSENRLHVQKAILLTLLNYNFDGYVDEEKGFAEKSSAGVFRRAGHLHHYPLAEGDVWLRSDRHGRRSGPARGFGDSAEKSACDWCERGIPGRPP
jgi:hypothetical protein